MSLLRPSIPCSKDPALFKHFSAVLVAVTLLASSSFASTLPGFRVTQIAVTPGFNTSLAADSHGRLYYTTQSGSVYRLDGSTSVLIGSVNTAGYSDSGLLGMALRNDAVAVLHYTNPEVSSDILADMNLTTGAVTVVHEWICDITLPGRPCSAEHRGGNPTVAPDGSVFVGLGDYNGRIAAALPEWNGGKIWRVGSDGVVEQYARGFRNPFDLAWLPSLNMLVATDNGPAVDDELNVIQRGGWYGWSATSGNGQAIDGAVPPSYVWPRVVAPTGMLAPHGRNEQLRNGLVVGSFVTRALYYFPAVSAAKLADPITLIEGETKAIIDVTDGPDGQIYFAGAFAIYRLEQPERGDCNGDGRVDYADVTALASELLDASGENVYSAQDGAFRGSWGCDANGDGLIDAKDTPALLHLIVKRRGSRK